MILSNFRLDTSKLKATFGKKLSLSTYFPEGTQYFYGYPAGEDSGFLNNVGPYAEELVAARALGCAGEGVSIVCFASTTGKSIAPDILRAFDVPDARPRHDIILPNHIGPNIKGTARNELIKAALRKLVSQKKFIMAQPFTDINMEHLFQFNPQITTWLNDKSNMDQYIDTDKMPQRYAIYRDGPDFAKAASRLNAPVVIKAASSSAGDGVYICKTKSDIELAVRKLKSLKVHILAEQYIDIYKNYAIHFGIPSRKDMPIDLLGINEQLTTKEGEFIGGIINTTDIPAEMHDMADYLVKTVLPIVRDIGWYGVGGIDVLLDKQGKCYFIDSNFRITGMSAYHFMVMNKQIRKPLLSIMAEIEGTADEVKNKLYPYASKLSADKFMQVIAISRHGKKWRFNAALSFTNEDQLKLYARQLLKAGVLCSTLEQIAR